MMNLFGDKLEQGVLEQFGEIKPHHASVNKAGEAIFSEILVMKKPTSLRTAG